MKRYVSGIPWVLGALVLLQVSVPAKEVQWAGVVVAVADGDTVRVAIREREITVHLYGARAPGKNQDFGLQAAKELERLVLGKAVTVIQRGEGPYRSVIGEIVLPDRTNVGAAMVKKGLVWWDERQAPSHGGFRGLQESARESRVGLWSAEDPTPPWAHRRSESVRAAKEEGSRGR